MKNLSSRIISAAALTVIILCLLGGFSRLAPEYMAKSLLNQRMSILQDALREQVSKQTAEEKLRRIEAEALLTQDLALLEQMEVQADKKMNKIKGAREGNAILEDKACIGTVGEMRQKKQYYQYTTYEAKVWPDGYRGQNANEGALLCNLVVKKEDRTFFLTVFEPENL